MKKYMTENPQNKNTKRRKNMYFTKVHENAIIEYAKTEDRAVRSDLYISYIGPAFNELVDKIVYTYKFNNLPYFPISFFITTS